MVAYVRADAENGAEMASSICALFDLDGVLLDSSTVTREAFESACLDTVSHGMPSIDGFQRRLGQPLETIAEALDLPDAFVPAFRRAAVARAHRVRPFVGVKEMLTTLKRDGFLVGVVTGKDRPRTLDLLARSGLVSLIGAVVTPDDAPGKPAPEGLWTCAQALGGAGIAGYVGDSRADMEAARRAGVPAFLALWGNAPPTMCDSALRGPNETVAAFRAAYSMMNRDTA